MSLFSTSCDQVAAFHLDAWFNFPLVQQLSPHFSLHAFFPFLSKRFFLRNTSKHPLEPASTTLFGSCGLVPTSPMFLQGIDGPKVDAPPFLRTFFLLYWINLDFLDAQISHMVRPRVEEMPLFPRRHALLLFPSLALSDGSEIFIPEGTSSSFGNSLLSQFLTQTVPSSLLRAPQLSFLPL